MHCDTLWKLIDLDGQGDLMKTDCHISIPSMKKAGTVVQLFACFTKAADYKKKGGLDYAGYEGTGSTQARDFRYCP